MSTFMIFGRTFLQVTLETLATGQEIILRQLDTMQATINLLANRFLGMLPDEQVHFARSRIGLY